MPSRASASASSPPRPKTYGSPPFSRSTRRPALASAISSAVISSCGIDGCPPRFPDEEQLGLFGDGDHCRVDQRVVDQRIGLAERRQHVERQAAGVARTGAGQPDMAGLETRRAGAASRATASFSMLMRRPFRR